MWISSVSRAVYPWLPAASEQTLRDKMRPMGLEDMRTNSARVPNRVQDVLPDGVPVCGLGNRQRHPTTCCCSVCPGGPKAALDSPSPKSFSFHFCSIILPIISSLTHSLNSHSHWQTIDPMSFRFSPPWLNDLAQQKWKTISQKRIFCF